MDHARCRLSILLVAGSFVATSLVAASAGATSGAKSNADTAWPLLIASAHSQGIFYLLTSEPCAKTRCLHLYRTRDAFESTIESALHVVPLNMPPYGRLARTPQGTVLAMVFATPEIGYVLEGNSEAQQLFVTTNGAHTWREASMPRGDAIWGLTATGPHLYALLVHCSQGTGCSSMELAHAPLNASHWSGVTIPFHQFYNNQPLGQVTGYGEMVMFSEPMKDGSKVYVSHNGGVTFVTSTHSVLKGAQGCALVAEDVQRVWTECQSGTRVTLHFSDDSGASWNVFVRRPHFFNSDGFFAMAGSGFAYVDLGTSGRNIVRMNLGANRQHTVGTLACRNVSSAVFFGVSHGYAVCNLANGATALERSIDVGVTWHRVDVP